VERQKWLEFMSEGETSHDGDGDRQSSGPSMVSQADAALIESTETADSPLLQEVLRESTLEQAWKQVRSNKGAPGIDGITIKEFPEWFKANQSTIMVSLRNGTYEPSPVRRKDIDKPGGGTRMLGIPTVLDRLIQQAIVIVLTPIIDPTFSESSYGFRPGRSGRDAVRQARQYVADGHRWVVDLDLSKFFDRVNHDVLMKRLSRRIKDKSLLRLIRKYLEAGMMADGVVAQREEGTPQGGPLSPLLANVLLDEWDKLLELRGHRFCRYADNCNIYVKSRQAGERVMSWCVQFLERRLRLQVNTEKSAVDRPWYRKFLGMSVTSGRQPKLRIASKSVERFKERIREITSRRRGISVTRLIEELNRYIRGWFGYFRMTESPSVLEELDGWIRRRIRCFMLKQWKPGRGRRRALRRLGVREASHISGSRKGPWRLSKTKQSHEGLNLKWFEDQGLFSLKQRWRELSQAN
jgi:group II intron reverse transcriptase/maturase